MLQTLPRMLLVGAVTLGVAAVHGIQPGDDETERAERLAPRVPGEVEAFSPVRDAGAHPTRPGLTRGEPWGLLDDPDAGSAAPLAERSFLNRVRGAVIAGPHQTRVLVVDAAEAGVPAAMLLLPCGVLERFDEFVFGRNERVPVIISGQVFRYDARNYLMPSAILASSDAGDAPRSPVRESGDGGGESTDDDDAETVPPAGGSDPDPVRDAEVDALIDELERRPVYSRRRRSGRSGGEPTQASGAPPATDQRAAPPEGLSEETRYIAARRGRMLRSPDGSWLFTEDNDEGAGARMTLLPCRMLQALEGVALREGDDAAVLLSGRVYRYYGRDYLLPTLFQRERRAGVDPLQ
jgi:hypothetical protein